MLLAGPDVSMAEAKRRAVELFLRLAPARRLTTADLQLCRVGAGLVGEHDARG
jgi:hypothetical protein